MRVIALSGSLLAAIAVVPVVVAAASFPVTATVETAPVPGTGDAADDAAFWIHPTNPTLSVVIGTDKSVSGHGLGVYDLSGQQLSFYPDGLMNNVDVTYGFMLGGQTIDLVSATNRSGFLDFYRIDPATRGLTQVGHVDVHVDLPVPRGYALYRSPFTGKVYALAGDRGARLVQYELTGASGTITATKVRAMTFGGPVEGFVADAESGALYVAQEDIGGIHRLGAEPNDTTAPQWVDRTTEVGGHIIQDVKGLSIYYGAGGTGYLIAASQGGNSFHVYERDTNVWRGEFAIVGGAIDAVTGMDGIDVTSYPMGGPFPSGAFVTQDNTNPGGNQNFKLVPWELIANAFSPVLRIETTFDPRSPGGGGGSAPDTSITGGPGGLSAVSAASLSFGSSTVGATFECSLDSQVFAACVSPSVVVGLADGAHSFSVRAVSAGGTDPTPATRSWVVDTVAPTVSGRVPVEAGTGVAVNVTVRATFSEVLDVGTVSGATVGLVETVGGAPVAANVSYESATRSVVVDPVADLLASTGYTVTVTTGVRDLAGNPVAFAASWSFTTASTPPPPPPPPPGGGIVRQGSASTANTVAASSIAVALPVGTTAGDVLVACVATNGATVTATGVPAGWAPIAAVTARANPKVFGYYRVAGAAEPASYSWVLSASVTAGAGIARYSGVDVSNPLDGAASTATGVSATTAVIPGVTTTVDNAMLVGCAGANSSAASLGIATPAGMTQVWDVAGKRHEVADGLQAVAGATGSRTWTLSSAREWAGWLVALRPA